jgi:hypothetical protein
MSAPDFEYIDTTAALAQAVEDAAQAPAYALDTEFHRETTYYAKVCLVQLAWAGAWCWWTRWRWTCARCARCWTGPGCASSTRAPRTSRSC